MRHLLAIVFLLVAPVQAYSQAMSGNQYLDLPENARLFYLGGITDMVNLFGQIEAATGEPALTVIQRCLGESRTRGQWEAMVARYLEEHPEEWDQFMPLIVATIAVEACRPGPLRD